MEPPVKILKMETFYEDRVIVESEWEDASHSAGIEHMIPASALETQSNSELELLPEEFDDELDNPTPFESQSIFDLVAQHFSGSDVKAVACVSRKLHRKISSSEPSMKKLLLSIDTFNEQNSDELLSSILQSKRCYANVEVTLKNDQDVAKKVDRILKRFSLSIIDLKITKIGGHKAMLNKPLWLLKLETLELHVVCGRVSGEFLQNVCTLRKLTVNGLEPEALLPCLQQNPMLEELTLYENSFISYFDHNLSLRLPFNLKKLAVYDHLSTKLQLQGEFPASQWNRRARINFFKFLRTQAESLTSLHLDVCFAEDLNHIIQLLPRLECLEVNKIAGDITKLRLEKNESISRFITSSNKINGFLLYAIVTNCVNLQSMFVFKLQVNQFLFITRFASNLTQFCYFWASETEKSSGNSIDLQILHQDMIQLDEGINPNLDIHVTEKESFLE